MDLVVLQEIDLLFCQMVSVSTFYEAVLRINFDQDCSGEDRLADWLRMAADYRMIVQRLATWDNLIISIKR